MFASRFSWLMVVKEERRFTGRARVVGLISHSMKHHAYGVAVTVVVLSRGEGEEAVMS